MSTPHDYYEFGPHPHLHNRGEGKDYVEPDWFANHHDGALPTISTIGRGPKGYGIKFHKDGAGNLIIEGDDPMQEPVTYHLGNWNIWVTQEANGEIVEGQNTEFSIHISDGNNVTEKKIIVPCGSQGSRVYFGDGGPYEYREDNTYQVGSIYIYPGGTPHEIRFPVPRTGDLVVFEVVDYPEYPNNQVAIGTIEAIDEEHGYLVAYAPVLYPVAVVNYNDLTNKPSINGVPLSGDKNASDLHLAYTITTHEWEAVWEDADPAFNPNSAEWQRWLFTKAIKITTFELGTDIILGIIRMKWGDERNLKDVIWTYSLEVGPWYDVRDHSRVLSFPADLNKYLTGLGVLSHIKANGGIDDAVVSGYVGFAYHPNSELNPTTHDCLSVVVKNPVFPDGFVPEYYSIDGDIVVLF